MSYAGFLTQLIHLDNELRLEKEHGRPRKVRLSTLKDQHRLPLSWHNEFWMPNEVTEEELGFVLLPMKHCLQSIPTLVNKSPSRKSTSTKSSRSSSKRNSFRAGLCSADRISSRAENGSGISRGSSFKRSRTASIANSVRSEAEDTEYEWVWETETEAEVEESTAGDEFPEEGPETLDLQQLNEIIAKPEEKWRRRIHSYGSPDISNRSSFNMHKGTVVAQAGVEENDPLSMVKVASAKQWKTISRKLTINFDDLEEDKPISSAAETEIETANGTTAPVPSSTSNLVNVKDSLITPPDSVLQMETKQTEPEITVSVSSTDNTSWKVNDDVPPANFKPTTVQELRRLCWQIKPWDQPRKTFAERQLFTSILATNWGCDADEVYPRILVGDQAAAKNIPFLKRFGITHVLNAAEGNWPEHCVNLNTEYYVGSGITYLVSFYR